MNRNASGSTDSLIDDLSAKSRTLFANLDRENKGFIDQSELADFCSDLSDDDVQKLFQELDRDGDGRISIADFREGFKLIGRSLQQRERRRSSAASCMSPKPYSRGSSKANSIDELDEPRAAPASLGECLQTLPCQDLVFDFYHQLSEERPAMLLHFESVLGELMSVITSLQQEQQRLEQSMTAERERQAKAIHDLELEVEHQVHEAELAAVDKHRECLHQEFHDLLRRKDEELAGLRQQLLQLRQRMSEGREADSDTSSLRQELEMVRSQKKELLLELATAETNLAVAMSEVSTLKQTVQDRDRELQRERENLQEQIRQQDRITHQMHQLHQANRQLRDKNEEQRATMEELEAAQARQRLVQQSLLAESALRVCDPNFCDSDNPDSGMSTLRDVPELDSEAEWQPAAGAVAQSRRRSTGRFQQQQQQQHQLYRQSARRQHRLMEEATTDCDESELDTIGEPVVATAAAAAGLAPHLSDSRNRLHRARTESEDDDCESLLTQRRQRGSSQLRGSTDSLDYSVDSRGQRRAAGSNKRSKSRSQTRCQETVDACAIATVTGNPERMFKVVLAGDAAVGKSSFIMRLCDNRFVENTTATLGVDFKTKIISVDGRIFALQLWDTAGQERFRSVAKSYFRRADGVLLLFDCTYERSFLSVREWVDQVQDAADKNIPIMICANKTDLRQQALAQNQRVIEYAEARKLAQEYDALFTETSARSGENVQQCVTELARLMQANEDMEVNKANVRLSADVKEKKTACCDF